MMSEQGELLELEVRVELGELEQRPLLVPMLELLEQLTLEVVEVVELGGTVYLAALVECLMVVVVDQEL